MARGTAAEPPHGRKDFRMKRAELDRRIANGETLEDIVPVLMDDGADITSYDDLKRFAIEKIESDELYLAEHVLKAMCMADADIEFIGEDNVPSASYTYVVTGAYDNFGGKVSIGAEEYLSRINIKVYEGDENGNLVFEGGAAECLAWADGYCGHC